MGGTAESRRISSLPRTRPCDSRDAHVVGPLRRLLCLAHVGAEVWSENFKDVSVRVLVCGGVG